MEKITVKKKWKRGFIVLLDILGVRNLTVEETDDFIDDFEKMEMKAHMLKGLIEYTRPGRKRMSSLPDDMQDAEIFLFGDTILISCQVKEKGEDYYLFKQRLLHISEYLAEWLKYGIQEERLRFRGSISYGEYCVSQRNIILGPAVADAAIWYEKAKWIGVMMTPKCSMFCDKIIQSDSSNENVNPFEWFMKTDIPTKEGLVKDIWAINWPHQFFQDHKSENTKEFLHRSTNEFLSFFNLEKVPLNSTDIFANTVSFFNLSKSKIEQLRE